MAIIDNFFAMLGFQRASDAAAETIVKTVVVREDSSFVNDVTNFGTAGDKSAHSRPNTAQTPLRDNELMALYRFNPYAKKGVDWLPDQSVRKGWLVRDDRNDNPGRSVMEQTDKDLCVHKNFADADRWARLYGGALIIMVTDDELDSDFEALEDGDELNMALAGEWARKPLDLDKVRKVLNLLVVDRREYTVLEWDGDLRSKDYRKPSVYQVMPRMTGAALVTSFEVHASRCIQFIGRERPEGDMSADYAGDSVLDSALEAIKGKSIMDNAGRIIGSEATLPVLKVAGLPAKGTAFSWDAFYARMTAIALGKSASNAVVLGADEEYVHHTTSLSGWGELDQTQKEAVACALDMPVTELFQVAPSGMNANDSAGESRKAQAVLAHQVKVFKPHLEKLYGVVYASKEGPTDGTVPERFAVEFRPIDAPDLKTAAEIDKLEAEADSIRIGDGVYTPKHVAKSRFANGENGLLPVDPEEAENDALRKQAMLIESMEAAAKSNGNDAQIEADEQGKQGRNRSQGDPQRQLEQ